jgi:hypothetical protein
MVYHFKPIRRRLGDLRERQGVGTSCCRRESIFEVLADLSQNRVTGLKEPTVQKKVCRYPSAPY